MLAAAQGAPGQSPPPLVFEAHVETVYVDAFVTRDGRPVHGLRAADFELRDNGVRQRAELAAAESRPLLALLVLDSSSSMEGEKLRALRAAGEAFLDGLSPLDQAALLSFSHEIRWLAPPGTSLDAVRRALAALRAEGATSVFDALYAGIVASPEGLRPLVVLFSDGRDNASWLAARQIRTVALRSQALVHVVGLLSPAPARGTPAPEEGQLRELEQIAEATGGRLWKAVSPGRLREAFAGIAEAMRHRYVLRYEPAGVRREGWHRLELRLRGHPGEVHARRGYWVER